MTINSAIYNYGEAAHAGIRIYVVSDDASQELTVRFYAKPASLKFLGHALSGLLEEEDCHFAIEPSGVGSAYVDRTRHSNAGLYFHRQPCRDQLRFFPSASGVGWLCVTGSFDEVPLEERHSGVSFVVFEGDATALSDVFFICASEQRHTIINAVEVAGAFRCSPALSLEIVPLEDARTPAVGQYKPLAIFANPATMNSKTEGVPPCLPAM